MRTRRRLAARLSLAALAATVGGLAGCDGCSPTSGGSTPATDSGAPNDTGTPNDSGSPESGTLTVTPATAKVLTCDTLQFQETGGPAGGTWSVSPSSGSGTVSGTGDYSAPLVLPSSTSAAVSYTAGSASASATVTLATAFVGAAEPVPLNGSSTDYGFVPLDHVFAASGTQVYAALTGPMVTSGGGSAIVEMQVAASTNGGATFGAPTTYHTGNLACASIAVDAGDPSVVYLAYSAGHGDSTTNTGSTVRLAVSTDGAKTFPVEYVVVDSGQGNPSWSNCPDVASPSADNVIVTEVLQTGGAPTYWVGAFASNNRGANIGPTDAEDGDYDAGQGAFVSPSDTNSASASGTAINADSELSPQVFANAKGDACLLYVDYASTGVVVQCSSNSGATWSAGAPLATSTAANTVPTGDISPGGNIAIAYEQEVTGDGGSGNATFVQISKDGGTTWSSPVQYPLPSWAAQGEQTSEAYLRWETDDVLWLSETVASSSNESALLVDKTCDFGQSWSGAVQAAATSAAGLIPTSSGMAAGSYLDSNAPGGPLLQLLPLAP